MASLARISSTARVRALLGSCEGILDSRTPLRGGKSREELKPVSLVENVPDPLGDGEQAPPEGKDSEQRACRGRA